MPTRPAPEFWVRDGLAARLLQPLAWANGAAGAVHRALARPWHASVPVLCIGNLVAGGAGKTPVALSLAPRLAARGLHLHVLTRGYGGRLAGPVAVDPSRHDAGAVGDEALLLAAVAPVWVARDRIAGAKAATAAGATCLIMDDGFQNPALAKDLSLLVIDGGYGFGNGRLIPAGPLREGIAGALARSAAIVLLGDDDARIAPRLGGATVLRGRLTPLNGEALRGARVAAFAGIGRPAKFFRSLEETGAQIVARRSFADHHVYRADELAQLAAEAARAGAQLVTTEKDRMRLPPAWQAQVATLKIAVAWDDPAAVDRLLDRLAEHRHG